MLLSVEFLIITLISILSHFGMSTTSHTASPTKDQFVLQLGSYKDTFFYRTYHAGKKCMSQVIYYIIESLPLNKCLPADSSNDQPYMFTCQLSRTKYMTSKQTYNDKKCAVKSSDRSVIYIKANNTCTRDLDNGYSYMTTCGGKLPTNLKTANQHIVQSFTNPYCRSGRTLQSRLLGVCTPIYYTPFGVLKNYEMVEFASQNESAINVTLKSYAIVAERAAYKCNGDFTTRTITYQKRVSNNGCKADPLRPRLYYQNSIVTANVDAAMDAAQSWMYIEPTAVPTTLPTLEPSRPTISPSSLPTTPSVSPTTKPTPRPTKRPSAEPTLYSEPTRVPTEPSRD